MKIRWWTATAAVAASDVMGVLARLWSGKRAHRGDEHAVFVALYAAADPVGARPFLVVPAVDRTFTEASRPGDGHRWSARAEPGGALLIETRQGEVLPAQAPGEPGRRRPVVVRGRRTGGTPGPARSAPGSRSAHGGVRRLGGLASSGRTKPGTGRGRRWAMTSSTSP